MATYYIGANDEHGQNPFTQGKRTPVMPYLNVPFYENQFNRPAKIKFMEACLRNGLAVYDVKPEITDTSISERVRRINAQRLTLLVTFGYNAFGSGNTFNSASGISVFYSARNTNARLSRMLSEDVYEQLINGTDQRGRGVSTLTDVGCASKRKLYVYAHRTGLHDQLRRSQLDARPRLPNGSGGRNLPRSLRISCAQFRYAQRAIQLPAVTYGKQIGFRIPAATYA